MSNDCITDPIDIDAVFNADIQKIRVKDCICKKEPRWVLDFSFNGHTSSDRKNQGP